MEIQNNKEQVPFEHYLARYRVLDPGEVSRRTGAEFDEQAGVFTLCLLGTTYRLHWPEYAIEADRERALALGSLPCQTFLLRFLLEGSAAQPSNHFVTFREMPWGDVHKALHRQMPAPRGVLVRYARGGILRRVRKAGRGAPFARRRGV